MDVLRGYYVVFGMERRVWKVFCVFFLVFCDFYFILIKIELVWFDLESRGSFKFNEI